MSFRAMALLAEMESRLPEPFVDADTELNPEIVIGCSRTIDHGGAIEWEVEWCPCDQERNFYVTADTLLEALVKVKMHDDAALAKRSPTETSEP